MLLIIERIVIINRVSKTAVAVQYGIIAGFITNRYGELYCNLRTHNTTSAKRRSRVINTVCWRSGM